MEKTRKAPLARQIAAVTLCVLMTNLAMADWRTAPATRYDGETLIRGIFFNRGPVADLLPEVWRSAQLSRYADQMRTAQAIEIQEKLLIRVRMDDAAGVPMKVRPAYFGEEPLEQAAPGTFFERFAADVQSGDRIRMQSAIREAAVRLEAASRVEAAANPRIAAALRGAYERDGSQSAVAGTEQRDQAPNVADQAAGVVVWVAVGLVVLAVVAAVAVDVWYISHPDPAQAPGRLQSEVFVDLMAQRLAH